jgi:hypothetical protein
MIATIRPLSAEGTDWMRSLAQRTFLLTALLVLSGCGQPSASNSSAAGANNTASNAAASAATPQPTWATALVGKKLADAFPTKGGCSGWVDGVQPDGALAGWAWDSVARRGVGRILLVDPQGDIVGGGDGGKPRPDVVKANASITDPNTGWSAPAPQVTGPIDVYGLTSDNTASCLVGHTTG